MFQTLNATDWPAQQIISASTRIFSKSHTQTNNQSISHKIKGLVLMGLISKYQDKQKQYNTKAVIIKWYTKVKAQQRKIQVFQRMFSLQSISQLSFLYRLKIFCRKASITANLQQKWNSEQGNQIEKENNQRGLCYMDQRIKQKQIQQEQYDQNYTIKISNNFNQETNKERDKNSNNKEQQKNNKSFLRAHLRSISQQMSVPVSTQRELSQMDIIDQFDSRLSVISNRLNVLDLRICQILMNRIIQRNKKFAFLKIKNK